MNRLDFPLLKDSSIVYLDNASTTQKPQAVIDAVVDFYLHHNANPGRGIYALGEKATELYEQARAVVASFIGALPSEIIFTKNATEGINFIAQSWARNHLKPGDHIVLTELEHHANLLPWQRVAKQTGAQIVYIPSDAHGLLDLSNLSRIITKKTKLVAVTHSSNALGTYVDLAPIIKAAHEVGALVLVDACQTVPHEKIDVKKMGADFLVFSGHKMLAPAGIGVLYINKKLHDQVEPYNMGGGIVESASYTDATFRDSPHKFEAGTPATEQAIGLAAAIAYLKKSGFEKLKSYEAELCAYLIEQLASIPCIQILGPVDQLKKLGHMVSFVVDGIHAHDVAAYLDTHGICVRAGHFCAQPLADKMGYDAAVRVSFYGYNTKQDVDALVGALKKLCA